MVCKKSIVSKILVIFLCVLFFVFNCLNVRAEGPYTTLYQDNNLYFFKGNFSISCPSGSTYSSIDFRYNNPEDVITFFYRNNYTIGVYSVSKSKSIIELTRTFYERDGDVTPVVHPTNSNISSALNLDDYDVETLPYITNTDLYWSICRDFAYSSLPDDFKPSGSFDYTYANDKPFILTDFTAEIVEDSVVCNWGNLSFDTMSYIPFPDTKNSLVRFSYILYPREGSGETRPIKFKQDKPISFNLHTFTALLGDIGVTENYYLYKLMATPYYYLDDNTENTLYSGYTSCVYFDEEGQVIKAFVEDGDYAEELPPDEDNVHMTIYEKISYFFSSFFVKCSDMLKDLFIPTKEQVQGLFSTMEEFFADRLGFLWFPFDLAFTIVEVFTVGDMAETFKVPPININILGGLQLYEGGEFAIDQVGLFPIVRMVTSIVLACSVATLAYRKWDEWIGGHDT